MKRVLALDDDTIILKLIEKVLTHEKIEVSLFTDGNRALESLRDNPYDLIISDLMMPHMDGEEFLHETRKLYPHVPFVFITSNDDIETVVRIMKMGADNYIRKPVKGKDIIHCLEKTFREKTRENQIRKTMVEDLIDEREQNGLFSWKNLYKSKESDQANKIMSYLSRNVEQGGGFKWLEMLKNSISTQDPGSGTVTLDRTMLDLIIESSEYMSKVLSDLSFVSTLMEEELPLEDLSLKGFLSMFHNFCDEQLIPLVAKHKKILSLNMPAPDKDYTLEIHKESLFRIINEVLCNAVKYSTDESKIHIQLNIKENRNFEVLELSFWNSSRDTGLRDRDGHAVCGIPYEYSESVFDLFYTMEQFPKRIPEEEWSQGSGLYISRKLLQKMSGEIEAKNIIMKTLQNTIPYVRITLYLPLCELAEELELL